METRPASGFDGTRAAEVLTQLRERGFTEVEANRIMMAVVVAPSGAATATPRVPHLQLSATVLLSALPSATTLVATQPEQLVSAMPTIDAFRFVIASANATLRVASPFIELNGLSFLEPWLRAAARRDVELVLLNRDPGGSPSAPQARAALKALFGSKLRVASYHITDEGRQLLSLHAKLLVADESVAYIGSAEVRRHSLELNFELGVLMAGIGVEGLVRLFDAIVARRPT